MDYDSIISICLIVAPIVLLFKIGILVSFDAHLRNILRELKEINTKLK